MLVLGRRIDETIRIGDDITVTVTGIRGDNVRIGIEAPRDVSVHREEIYLRIQNGENPVVEGHLEKADSGGAKSTDCQA